MTDAKLAAAGRLTIRIAQILLVASAVGLWAASRLAWVDLRTFDGLSPPKLTTLSGAAWSSALLPWPWCCSLPPSRAGGAGMGLAGARGAGRPRQPGGGYLAVSTLEIPDVAARAAELARVPLVELVGSQRYYPGPVITLVAAVLDADRRGAVDACGDVGPRHRHEIPDTRRPPVGGNAR